MRNSRECVGLLTKRKRPHVVGAIVKNNEVVFETTDTRYGRSPHITVHKVKGMRGTRLRVMKRKANMTTTTKLARMTDVTKSHAIRIRNKRVTS
jgi:hypothetical protein